VLVSGQMALSNSSGKIDVDTVANNAYGQVLCVRPDRWVVGWKRRMTTEVQRWAAADATQIVTFLRIGLVAHNGEATAISYNVAV